jgi:hypothetical protein
MLLPLCLAELDRLIQAGGRIPTSASQRDLFG